MKTSIPQKLTPQDHKRLKHYFHLYGWHFDSIIGDNCVKISDHFIGWEKTTDGKDEDMVEATLYGLEGMNATTKKPVLCKYFLKYGARVYQPYSIAEAVSLVALIEKEFKWEEYIWSIRREKGNKSKKVKRVSSKKSSKKSQMVGLQQAA